MTWQMNESSQSRWSSLFEPLIRRAVNLYYRMDPQVVIVLTVIALIAVAVFFALVAPADLGADSRR